MREKKEAEKKDEKGKARVWVFVELYEKQLNSAAGNLNVCDAPLCGCMSKHFTCPLVALRFEGTFHVFAKAKTFHFSAFDMFAFRSHL